MTCTEHHKVSWEWDSEDKKDRDGYLFSESDGTIWANQYPRAVYGQMDDSQDRKVHRHYASDAPDDTFERALKTYPDDELIWGITDARSYLENILRALNPKSMSYLGDDAKAERESLEEFRDYLVAKIEEASGMKVRVAPWTFTKTTGETEVVPTVQKVSLVPAAQAA